MPFPKGDPQVAPAQCPPISSRAGAHFLREYGPQEKTPAGMTGLGPKFDWHQSWRGADPMNVNDRRKFHPRKPSVAGTKMLCAFLDSSRNEIPPHESSHG